MSHGRIIGAFVAALLAFALAAAGVTYALPAQVKLADPSKNYGYVYSGAKSSSIAFATASQTPDTFALFGSSELSTPPSLVPEVPATVFGNNNYGIDLLCIGEAFDQSLWHAIAAGAYADSLANKKVAIIVSPNWFFDGGVDNSVFGTRFSYSLYHAFAANSSLSPETKEYVQMRLAQQGIADSVVNAPWRTGPLEVANDAAYSWTDDLRLRQSLQDVSGFGFVPEKDGQQFEPPFATIREHALANAKERASNEWGFDDDFYAENVGEYKDQIAGHMAGETFADTAEYDDFGLFLRVCQESGLDPLVIVSPLSGDYFDWVGIDAATRRSCYDHVIDIAEAYGVTIADFSDREYELYFLHDQVHFGGPGWVDVEEALYRFMKEG